MTAKQHDRRRSAGTVIGPLGALKVFSPRWRQQAQASDAAAIERGETRTVLCWFRGLYGDYPRRFLIYFLDLGPDGLVLRKYLLFWLWKRISITEAIISASPRPPASAHEARRVGANGAYGSGGSLEIVGNQIVNCQTMQGVLEFAVKRTDAPLLLHYISMHVRRRNGH